MDNLITDLIQYKIINIDLNNEDYINFNFNNIISYPHLVSGLLNIINNKLKNINVQNIIGISNIGLHLSSILSYNYNINLLLFGRGSLKKIYGTYEDNSRCVLLTDIIYSGKSLEKNISIIKKNLITVDDIIVLCDYSDINYKYKIHSIFNKNYILDFIKKHKKIGNSINFNLDKKNYLNNRISYINNDFIKKIINICKDKKTRICYSCNKSNIKDIIEIIKNIGKFICILSVNSYFIENFNDKYGMALKKLADNYNFVIVDDLGISDIKYINKNIVNWCNIITVSSNFINENNNMIFHNFSKYNFIVNCQKDDRIKTDSYQENIISYRNIYQVDNRFLKITETINNVEQIKNTVYINYDIIDIGDMILNNKSVSEIHLIFNYINNIFF
jgi:orotate phosphoribosyltransferase